MTSSAPAPARAGRSRAATAVRLEVRIAVRGQRRLAGEAVLVSRDRICGTTAPSATTPALRAPAGTVNDHSSRARDTPAGARCRRIEGHGALHGVAPRAGRPRSSGRRELTRGLLASRGARRSPTSGCGRGASRREHDAAQRSPTDVRGGGRRESSSFCEPPAGTSTLAATSMPGALTDQTPAPPPASLSSIERVSPCAAARVRRRRPRAPRTGPARRRPGRRSSRRRRRERSSGACARCR